MTDTRLRELERRWQETRSVEDEAAYLLQRVRSGDLGQHSLELAAYCGHAGARAALGGGRPAQPDEIYEYTKGLLHWGSTPCIRASWSLHLCNFSVSRDIEDRGWVASALRALAVWIVHGDAAAVDQARELGGFARRLVDTAARPERLGEFAAIQASAMSSSLPGGEIGARAKIAADLMDWALGRADPIRDWLTEFGGHLPG